MVTRRLVLGHGVLATFMLPEIAPGRAHASPARLNTVLAPPPAHIAPLSKAPPPLVFLDPGHGGKDPGAIGITGTYEKDIALAAAKELMRQLLADRRYRVELSRGLDVFIPLEERVAIAQRKGAAIFVSMHADAINDPGVRGASVYTLAGTASDAQTAALAKRENSADRFAGPNYGAMSPEVANILASLVRQETRAGSARIARGLVGSLDRDVRLLANPERHAGFVVLKAADIPSVLVEMGFMSNHEDEAALRKPEHRAKVAGAMKRAVDSYFAENAGQHMAG
jgi:N-acetylmuramoyl-L-alanine amidase